MTRPMPGPPGGFTDRARLNYALLGKQITYEQYQEFGAELTRAFTARPKRLTDAECAAEYWMWATASERVRAFIAISRKPGESVTANLDFQRAFHEQVTWHRFATHPHALEES